MQSPSLSPPRELEAPYVKLMLDVMGRAFEAATQIDEPIRKHIAPFPPGYLFEMGCLPDGPAMVLEKQADGSMSYLGSTRPRKTNLSIRFKHVSLAFLVLSFQESTARAFANDRAVLDGEVADAMKIVRCLNRLEAFILPKVVAERAVKRYPDNLALQEKVLNGARIYAQTAVNFIKGVVRG